MKKINTSLRNFWICNFMLLSIGVAMYVFFEDPVSSMIFTLLAPFYSIYAIYAFPVKSIIFDKENEKITVKFWNSSKNSKFLMKNISYSYKEEVATRMGYTYKRLRVFSSLNDQIIFLSPELLMWKEEDIKFVAECLNDFVSLGVRKLN